MRQALRTATQIAAAMGYSWPPNPGLSRRVIGRGWSGTRKVLLTCEDLGCLGPDQRRVGSTTLVKKTTELYPALTVDGRGASLVPNAGAVLLLRTAETVDLSSALVEALRPWQRPLARHRPDMVLLDLAVGEDCLADIGQVHTGAWGRSLMRFSVVRT